MAKSKAFDNWDEVDMGGATDKIIESAPSSGRRAYLKLPPGIKMFAPKVDVVYNLIFLPWKPGKYNPVFGQCDWTWGRFLKIHHGMGMNDERLLCLAQYGRPCPGCELFQKARSNQPKDATTDWWEKNVKPLQAKNREVFFVHNLDGEKDNLMVWEESVNLFGDFLRERLSMSKRYRSFFHPTKGYIVQVKGRKKPIKQSSCNEFTSIDFIEREDPLAPKVMEAITRYCVDDFVVALSYKDFKAVVEANVDGEEVQDEEVSQNGQEESTHDEAEEFLENAQDEREQEAADERATPEPEEEETFEEEEPDPEPEPVRKPATKPAAKAPAQKPTNPTRPNRPR